MNNASLVLCPLDPYWTPPDDVSLGQFLQSIQLIGRPYQNQSLFLAGDRFLELVAFMGCSPDISLDPGDNGRSFCSIHLQPYAVTVEFHCGDHTHTPRCPRCRAPVNNWQGKIAEWKDRDADSLWSCPHCQHEASPWQFNWRRSAGFGRCFIEINDIFPKEAIPQQQLLDKLNSHYGVSWHYFYQY